MGKTRMGPGIIKRASVDTSLENLSSGLKAAQEKLVHNVNVAWNAYADAISAADKAQREADKTAANTLKKDLERIDIAYQKAVTVGKGNFEATEQKREAARAANKRELEHNQENFDSKAQAAAVEFRGQTGDFEEDLNSDVNDVLQNFASSHP